MHSSADTPLNPRIAARTRNSEAVVQDRPTLGTMPRTRRGVAWWMLPVVDLVSSSIALTAVALASGSGAFPALPISPLILVAVYGMLGVYGASTSRGNEGGTAWPV